jgi:DNA replication initiation complex subunit (GINS family)
MFENSLRHLTSTINAAKLQAAADELAKVRSRIVQLENRHAEAKEERQHESYMAQQARMQQIAADQRRRMNNRWVR